MDKLVVNLYGSPTCMPCKILKKTIGVRTDITFNYYNALDYPELGIKSTPYLILTKGDKVVYEGHPNTPSDAQKLVNENL